MITCLHALQTKRAFLYLSLSLNTLNCLPFLHVFINFYINHLTRFISHLIYSNHFFSNKQFLSFHYMYASTFVCCQPSSQNQHNDTSMVNRKYHSTPWSRQRSVSHLPLSLPICFVCQRFPKLICVSPMVTLRRPVFT